MRNKHVSWGGTSEYDYSHSEYDYRNALNRPRVLNPNYFKIHETFQCGDYVAARISWPDSSDNKVLVYNNIDSDILRKAKAIDPKFSKKQFSPIAEFEDNEQGWVYAMKFCSMLHSERLEVSY